MSRPATILATLCLAALAFAARADEPPVDPLAILGAAKAATGGSNWNDLKYQHSRVTIETAGETGTAERWSEFASGRSYLTFDVGAATGAVGFDGTSGWAKDPSGEVHRDNSTATRELSVNAAYRDRLAFWFPTRHPATLAYKGREHRDGADFDVVGITPVGGHEFDLWVNSETHLIERLVEREGKATRTEFYMDYRDVGGVRVPFRVRTTRGADPRYDEVVIVDAMDFDPPAKPIDFGEPAPPPPDYTFPAGVSQVEVPFTLANGHIYIDAKAGGKTLHLMFDAGGTNVLSAETAKAMGLAAAAATDTAPPTVTLASLDVGGVVIASPTFASVPLAAAFKRIEGVDDVAGVIGYELVRRFPVRIDWTKQRLVLYAPQNWKYDGNGTRVAIRLRDGVPVVDGSVDGIAGAFELDTSSRNALTLTEPFVSANGLTDKLHASAEIITGSGASGPSRTRLARVGSLKLGEVEVTEPVTLLSTAASGRFADPDIAGIVGNGILRRFDIVLDVADNAVWLEKNAAYGERDTHERAGVWVERAADGFAVVDVLADGPAAKAGLKAGDVITAVEGGSAARVTLDALRTRFRAPAGTRVKLTLKGGRSVTITLRDLV
jgi:PDZ domain